MTEGDGRNDEGGSGNDATGTAGMTNDSTGMAGMTIRERFEIG